MIEIITKIADNAAIGVVVFFIALALYFVYKWGKRQLEDIFEQGDKDYKRPKF